MADAEEKARQEKIAAARKRVEEMKKKRGMKSGGDKKDAADTKESDTKESDTKETDTRESDTKDPADTEPDTKEPDTKEPDTKEPDTKEPVAASDSPPSIAQQSKLRSSSFRTGSMPVSPAPFSPDGDTAPDIYRKHVARIEELEKENKRLAREVADSERRWNKAEESLSELREAETRPKGDDGLTEKLENEVASLQRQNAQLQQQVSRGHSHRLSVSSPLQSELDSKTATIESMEIEISRLKARVERQESGASSEREQVTALEEKLTRAEAAAGKAQRELQDAKRNLERATEKAVREGGERSSAETKAKTLESELAEVRAAKDEAELRTEAMEKKVATLTTLHREQDSRSQALRKDKERAEKELSDLRAKMEKVESDNIRLRSRKSVEGGGGLDDEGVDELEDEERLKLEKKIRSLEREVHELRSGVWIEKRREMEASSFQDVDLGSGAQPKKAGFGEFLASGFNALAGGGDEDLMDDVDFDEDAFRKAQQEEGRKRLERIKEVKRSLKHWEGWRLDLVDLRRGGEGGDIFDV
ncbi:myosin heavy chain [Ophiocordyceps camponoti-floridani]|uniref:Myosin heavy chain n=1 Tax=Ophiocordyceps camponoti-floridani TaxID=2030778 RepID=A0A8H4Q203_9HYPO|nr:myosin heavy chain [Ophiocordyceps camponoti-floridani]